MASYYLPVSTLNKWKLSSVTCIQIFTDKVSTVNSLQKLHEYFYLGAACEMTMTVIVGLKFFYLLVFMLGLRCCTGFSLVVETRGDSLVSVHGLLISVASLVMNVGSRVCRLR